MPSGDGVRSRHQLMADSMSVMWMAAMRHRRRGGKDTARHRHAGPPLLRDRAVRGAARAATKAACMDIHRGGCCSAA
jgi:hypothetical protein